ncbi:hypothetical protein [Tessaracoccus sp. OH4464_COT-324]|uniref:hypothetical protein n=1 Tax=Tessaracoccus sp. OH4464_COT-324 TaxID=2491059 RepID=UPI000F62D5BE|nr:hypothetical protein [Tessaracoccus sp. OH4464_COT-324]RRD46741.1 hypothetical protein EII42_05815 [Tessaracoccus sp. OH4464_COT-324]
MPSDPPNCVSLETHDFSAIYLCSSPRSDEDYVFPSRDYGFELILGDGVLSAYYRNAIVEWDLTTRKPTRLLGAARTTIGAFTRTPSHTVAATTDDRIAVHDQNGCLTGYLASAPNSTHRTRSDYLCALPEGRVAGLDNYGRVCVWDTASLRLIDQVRLPLSNWPSSLAWDAANRRLVLSQNRGQQVVFLDPDSLSTYTIRGDLPTVLEPWAPMPDGTLAACGDGSGKEGVWLLRDNQQPNRITETYYKRLRVASSGQLLAIRDSHFAIIDRQNIWESTAEAFGQEWVNFAFAPDGDTAYLLRYTDPILEVSLKTGEAREFAVPGE